MTPPQDIGMSTAVVLATKRIAPTQSTRPSLVHTDSTFWFKFKNIGIKTNPIAQNGRLMYMIHLQETFWEKPPPRIGPQTLPRAQVLERKPK
jgi:hypothetical protein